MDTIFSLASARGKAGVSVVRISGPDAFSVAQDLCGSLPAPRFASLRNLCDENGDLLDQVLVLVFEDGHSFTGEPTVELHLHGSTATVSAVLAFLGRQKRTRQSEPGEFTRRAMENGRLDLAQVEGLADLIDAETEMQRKQAVRVLSGALGELAKAWRHDLVRGAALLEATIDFADEDVPVDVLPDVQECLTRAKIGMMRELSGAAAAERIRDGFEVAIVGPPNAGKSTLLNALAGRDAAITSEIAGTTRDVIEVRMDIKGFPVTFLDTAGLRETEDFVESLGVEKAIERAKMADIRVFLLGDGSTYNRELFQNDDILMTAKGDLDPAAKNPISGKTGLGVSSLIDRIVSVLEQRTAVSATATRERHRVAMAQAISAIEAAEAQMDQGAEFTELAAEEIRSAVRSLESLVGFVDVEHLLDEIFSSFCIGK